MFNQMLLFAQAPVEFAVENVPVENLEVSSQEMQQLAAVALGAFLLYFLFLMFVALVTVVVLAVIPLWMICKKAGLSPYLSLLVFVPVVNAAMWWILALIEWPNLKKENPNWSVPPANQGDLTHFPQG